MLDIRTSTDRLSFADVDVNACGAEEWCSKSGQLQRLLQPFGFNDTHAVSHHLAMLSGKASVTRNPILKGFAIG